VDTYASILIAILKITPFWATFVLKQPRAAVLGKMPRVIQ
jgi:hypothetical protein